MPYAGGRAIVTPFGSVEAGNLTPDVATGLGNWNADDFWRALHHGVGRDGRALLPAFPYAQYTKVTREDSDALWAYLRSVPAVARANRPHDLRFPYNLRWAQRAWKAMYFKAGEYQPDTHKPAAWNRGAYLVQGLGHCAACHAPRNRWGGSAAQMSGGEMPGQGWWAPPLGPGSVHPTTTEALIDLLRKGQSPLGTAMGPMAEVVVQSTQHWRDEDLKAVAQYLESLPSHSVSKERAFSAALPTRGLKLYKDRCAECHGEEGEGAPGGVYPPLAGNASVLEPSVNNLVRAVRHGGFAPATKANPRPYGMPPADLDDAALAELLTVIRRSWGNEASAVTELMVWRAR